VGKLAREQVERAVEALRAYASSKSSGGLVGEDACLSIVLATKRMPKTTAGAKAVKPRLLTLPHAWRTLDETEMCLIVKDPQRTIKDMCAAEGITAKVIGVEKLKKKYVPFEARRRLRGAYDFFAADERVLPLLPKLLGSEFYRSNKLPLPLNFKRKALRECLERAVGGAILRPSQGTCISVACASTAQTTAEAAENVMTAVDKVVARTPGKWQNVSAIHLRTVNSAALPIYNAV
jgi:ribosome biogenesis protein UTP30